MPTDKAIRSAVPSAADELKSLLRSRCSNLYHGVFAPRDNPVDVLSFKRGDAGVWLCVVKRYNTASGTREVAFGHGGDMAEALVNANKIISGGKWVPDKPWGR